MEDREGVQPPVAYSALVPRPDGTVASRREGSITLGANQFTVLLEIFLGSYVAAYEMFEQ